MCGPVFEDSRSNLWVGTSSHGVYQCQHGRFVSMFDRSRISDRVNAIYEDRRGRIWFGHWGGLACYADGQLTRVPMPWFSDDHEVVAVAEDRKDRLWLGTKGAGLFCLQDGKFASYTVTNGLPSNLAWSLFVDRHDTLWIGTADGGLSCLRDGHFVNFTTRDGLADNTVCHILEDATGQFWFSSPHGVFSAHRTAFEAFVRGENKTISWMAYGQSDGMLSSACTCAFQPSGCMTRDGRLLFPTLKGVAVLRPDAVAVEPLPPPAFIEEIAMGEKVHELSGPATLTVPPGRSRLEIRYTALNFSAPETVRFRHRLEGLDSAWVNSGAKRVVDYSYLPQGRYRFEVQACNNDGLWSPQSASIELILLPYFWQTRWFIGIVLLAGAVSIAFTVRRLEKAKSKRRLESEKQARLVELERARIARDFHDGIGSDLTAVIVLSELIKRDHAQPKEVEVNAAMISNTARKAVQGLRTIIWAANPKNDTLDSLVQYISQYSDEFCEAASLPCRLDLPTEVPALPLIAEVRHNLFMVVKEALHNVLKHAHASEVRLSLKLHEGLLELRVEDNGRGFKGTPSPPASAAVWPTCGTGWRPSARPWSSRVPLAPALPFTRAGRIQRTGPSAWSMNHHESKAMSTRVALVEDNDDLRNSIKRLLQRSPQLRVVADYPDAESALSDLVRHKPDVVLMDVKLPKMDGVECVRQLKSLLPTVLVVMLTVHDDNDSLFNSILAGADGFLLKDTVPARLVKAIEEVRNGGSPMTPQIARRIVQRFRKGDPEPAVVENLTSREQEVLEQLALGNRYKEISENLGISLDGIRFHIRGVYNKLHVHSRTEAVVKYLKR